MQNIIHDYANVFVRFIFYISAEGHARLRDYFSLLIEYACAELPSRKFDVDPRRRKLLFFARLYHSIVSINNVKILIENKISL